ncbi:NHL repeat protein [Ancylostoma ceylanicum]|uniref:NHL repeat protein n=1 Tax=Ancylostoma ceylanicum TaxID=53326 RepID=A0A0D6LRP4_9BILA|nr:NHL repeat protein [Ancylostoma ceylanicum]
MRILDSSRLICRYLPPTVSWNSWIIAAACRSPAPSHTSGDSKPGSVMSSIPAYPCDQSFGSAGSSTSQAVTPTPFTVNGSATEGSSSTEQNNGKPERVRAFGKNFLTRPICVQAFSTKTLQNHLAVSDSCGGSAMISFWDLLLFDKQVHSGVYITDVEGNIKEHVLVKNSSASSVAVDEKNDVMYVSIMQSKGRSVHVFDIANGFKKLDIIVCPKDPKIEMSRTRWLTVGPRGQLFMVSGDNVKSALWCYVRARKAWKTLKESRKTRYQYLSVAEDQAEYKAVVLLTCDAANNRLLLFVIDHTISLINEYDLSKTYRLAEHITSPASAIVDGHGNLLVLDYANGKLWILLSGVKGVRRLKEIHFDDPLRAQEALGISASGDDVYVACFNRCEVRIAPYLEGGVFTALNSSAMRSASHAPRSASLPRPPESQLAERKRLKGGREKEQQDLWHKVHQVKEKKDDTIPLRCHDVTPQTSSPNPSAKRPMSTINK